MPDLYFKMLGITYVFIFVVIILFYPDKNVFMQLVCKAPFYASILKKVVFYTLFLDLLYSTLSNKKINK
jgi:hypothetical protein